jgi:hypothetical protein
MLLVTRAAGVTPAPRQAAKISGERQRWWQSPDGQALTAKP